MQTLRRPRPSPWFLRALALGSLGLVSSFVACADLPDIPEDVCGNGVIDRDKGEECDTIPDPAYSSVETLNTLCDWYKTGFKLDASTKCEYACAAADASHACQYVWGQPADSSESGAQAFRICPPGFGIGADGQCRRGSNRFEASSELTLGASGFDGRSADLDGDGFRDLVILSQGGVVGPSVTYLDSGGLVAGPLPTNVRPMVGELTEDDLRADDLVLPIGAALVTLRGEPGPSYSPKVYTPFPLAGDLPIPLPLGATVGDRRLLATKNATEFDVPYVVVEVAGLPGIGKALGFIQISLENFGPASDVPFSIHAVGFDDLRGGPISVDIALPAPPPPPPDPPPDPPPAPPDTPPLPAPGEGGEIIVATKDSIIITSRAIDPPPDPPASFDEVSTAEQYALAGLNLDIGSDAKIVSLLEVANWHTPAVAAVLSTGEIVLLEQYTEGAPRTWQLFDLPLVGEEMPVHLEPSKVKAVGDIDGDGDLDLVTDHSVLFIDYGEPAAPSPPPPPPKIPLIPVAKVTVAAQGNTHSWSQARIADLNGNGRMSVIATPTSSGVDVFLPGTSFAMSPATLATTARVDQLEIGDFDGDGAADILVGTDVDDLGAKGANVKESCDQYDDIEVAYGRPAGPPEDFALLGNLPGLRRIITGRLAVKGQEDAISDVGLEIVCDPSTLEEGRQAGLLFGSTDRAVYSPYLPFNGRDERDAILVTGAVGQFSQENPAKAPVHNDLMVLTLRPTQCPVPAICTFSNATSIGYEISPVFGTGDAELSAPTTMDTPSTVVSLPIDDLGDKTPPSALSHAPAILAAELDGDPATEEAIVLTTPTGAETLDAHLLVVKMEGHDPQILFEQTFSTNIHAQATTAKLRLIDYDQDGQLDVVAIIGFSGPGGAGAQAFLARNKGGGDLAAAVEIDPAELYPCATSFVDALPISETACPTGATKGVCADAARNLLVATERSISLCTTAPGAQGIVADECSPFLDVSARSDVILGTVMDDFDGDGLIDLAVMRAFGTEIHRQCAMSEVLSGKCDTSKSSKLTDCAQ